MSSGEEQCFDFALLENSSDIIQICGICGENHSHEECTFVNITNHIQDKQIPSKAKLTLPDCFEVTKLCDGTFNVFTQIPINEGTLFGPFQAKKIFTLNPFISFPLKIFMNSEEDFSEYFLDTSNEDECSWLVYISPASDIKEQNLICYQQNEDIYYVAYKDIKGGEALKVWYSPHYAHKMKKDTLDDDHSVNLLVDENIAREPSNIDLDTLVKEQQKIRERNMWNCKFCGTTEVNVAKFARHMLEHYKAQLRKVCEICNDLFANRKNLKKHLRIVHSSKLSSVLPPKEIKESIKTKSNTKENKEVTVGGPLLNNILTDSLDNSNLILHPTNLDQFGLVNMENQNVLLESDSLNLNVDNLISDNDKALDHFNFEIDEFDEQVVCDICLKSFFKLRSLVTHLQHHTGEFICMECNKIFSRKENLKSHSCTCVYQFSCPKCGKCFTQRKYLTQHIQSAHERKFECKKCNKAYSSFYELSRHNCAKVDFSEKQKYTCHICGKNFFHVKNLKAHLQRHEGIKMKKMICEICSQVLKNRKSYHAHLKTHQEPQYPCEICDKKFQRMDTLNHHLLSHSDAIANFPCPVCDKRMKTQKRLKIHMQIHSVEKKHKCSFCSFTCKQRTNLARHIKCLHKEEKWNSSAFLRNLDAVYSCPCCDKKMKLKSSLSRHLKNIHFDYYSKMSINEIRPKKVNRKKDKKVNNNKNNCNEIPLFETYDEQTSIRELKETIENMNFTSDIGLNCNDGNYVNMELENMLNSSDNISSFLNDSNDMVEKLLNITANVTTDDNQSTSLANGDQANELCLPVENFNENVLVNTNISEKKGCGSDKVPSREVCLSMPDLTDNDQEIRLGKNAYILENGTIVEPQENSDNVVVYILDQKFS